MTELKDRPVLVTGATGFIGAHLAQRLAQEQGARVTGIGRNLEAVPFLRKAGVTMRRVDLLDFPAIQEVVQEQAIIFHVAAWLSERHGPRDMAWPINVYATQQLVRSAAEAGAQRIVLASSIAAYGPPPVTIMTEDQPLAIDQPSLYGRTKAEGELKAMALAKELGLELTVLRLGMVYGPRSYGWTLRMLRLVQRRVPVIFGGGLGHAAPIYVDNLVDGMILAATEPAAAGEAFNMVDAPVSWREWFSYYGQMAGKEPVALPLWMARIAFAAIRWLPLGFATDRSLRKYYEAKTIYPHEKARRLLGYRPQVGLEEGMRRSEAWLRAEGHI